MSFILLIASLVCALIAAAMGFQWFGTDPADWAGWISLAFALFVVATILGSGIPDLELPRRRRD